MGGLMIYPNPNKGEFTIKGSLISFADENAIMAITDVMGQVIFEKQITAVNGQINEKLSIGKSVPAGMYILTIHSANESSVYHFVIEE